MYLIVANLASGKEVVDCSKTYDNALFLQREYSMAFNCAVEIVKKSI